MRISGLDLAGHVHAETKAVLRDALDAFGLLLVADQNLAPQQELDAVRIFNQICDPELTRNEATIPGYPEIFVLSNLLRDDGTPVGFTNRNGMEWHTDGAGWPQPPLASAIYALEVPANGGGRTHFADGFEAYTRLGTRRQAQVDGMLCRYSFSQQLRYLADASAGAPPPQHLLKRYPDVVRPLVRVHPTTGRKALWFGTEDVAAIEGMSASQTRNFLRELVDGMTSDPEIVYAHAWTEGEMAFFDNRRLLHSPSEYDYEGFRRLMHQITGRDTGYVEPRERILVGHDDG